VLSRFARHRLLQSIRRMGRHLRRRTVLMLKPAPIGMGEALDLGSMCGSLRSSYGDGTATHDEPADRGFGRSGRARHLPQRRERLLRPACQSPRATRTDCRPRGYFTDRKTPSRLTAPCRRQSASEISDSLADRSIAIASLGALEGFMLKLPPCVVGQSLVRDCGSITTTMPCHGRVA
jgi:hypothetical protein